MSSAPENGFDAAIVGGCGHVGLPLGLSLADRGLRVALYDIDADVVELVSSGRMPFKETGTLELLERMLQAGRLEATTDPAAIARATTVIVVVGTPIDEHLNPAAHVVPDAIDEIRDHLRDGQLLILRSTVYPGVTAMVEALVSRLGVDVDVAFCPER
ncbi:MAG: nucleotide sugar dehydrogenase, partial [Gaiellaceae bacterium]